IDIDSDIHSANPLARRHDRIPVKPFFDSADSIVKASAAASIGFIIPSDDAITASDACALDDPDATAWFIPNPNFRAKIMDALDIKSKEIFYSEMDPFLDFDYSNFFHNNSSGNDNVVPVQTKPSLAPSIIDNHQLSESCFNIDCCRTKLSSINYPSQSLSQSVSTTTQ
ncbi:zinc finger protein CONSTANS-LIKE 5-like, partial [Vigna radiata var. radiata]|uniref:Zinc finger protein CONSTANS-LIKE 5-like n=1 Tax=Vigna radiata var. radiata TaxID=3916 RepID=A0A3Q0ENC5_VIGRR